MAGIADTPKVPVTKWWQWLLVYPTLIVAMIAAVPTVVQQYKAWRLEVGFNEVQKVEEQRQLWERNVQCLSEQGIYAVDAHDGGIVGVTLCVSGDALLRYQYGEDNTQYVWVKSPRPYRKVGRGKKG